MAALTLAVVAKSMARDRTTSSPARSSVSASRIAAANPTPIANTSAPRRQYPATTRPKAASRNSPTVRIGHCPANTLCTNCLVVKLTLRSARRASAHRRLVELDHVGQQERPRQGSDPARIRRHVARDVPDARVDVPNELARAV